MLVFVLISVEGILTSPQEFIVDITPNKNILLKAGTSEYDVASGIDKSFPT
jgi:hypothetical protein